LKGRVNRRYLGIAASGIDIPARLAKEPGHARGVYVHRVENGSPAHRGGLRDGDILTRAEAKDLWNLDDLQRVVSLGDARAIEVEILRDEERVTAAILPAEHPRAA
jgi:S1-C subfamily serine protease